MGYRNYVIAEAARLGVDGWIRNRADGTVEVAGVGTEQDCRDADRGLCMRGPPGSTVRNVEMHKAEPAEEKGFKRRPSL